MRVSSCNCHYPLVCCSKSLVCCCLHRPPKPQCVDSQHVSTVLKEKPSDEKVVIEQNSAEDGKVQVFLKSSLKKPGAPDSAQVGKGNVKWMDLLGKELVEVKEFETIESEEPEDYPDDSTGCICVVQ